MARSCCIFSLFCIPLTEVEWAVTPGMSPRESLWFARWETSARTAELCCVKAAAIPPGSSASATATCVEAAACWGTAGIGALTFGGGPTRDVYFEKAVAGGPVKRGRPEDTEGTPGRPPPPGTGTAFAPSSFACSKISVLAERAFIWAIITSICSKTWALVTLFGNVFDFAACFAAAFLTGKGSCSSWAE